MAKVEEQKGAISQATEGITRYYRETRAELMKVSWPTREEAIRLTMIVLVVIFVMATFLGGFDYLFTELFKFLVSINAR